MCIYSYNGQKADELPLIRGEIYCVIERYRDGWCKGYRARSKSKRTGMFPGNYLKPARYVYGSFINTPNFIRNFSHELAHL